MSTSTEYSHCTLTHPLQPETMEVVCVDSEDTMDCTFFREQMKKLDSKEQTLASTDCTTALRNENLDEFVQAVPKLKKMNPKNTAACGLSAFDVFSVVSSEASVPPSQESVEDVMIIEDQKPFIKDDDVMIIEEQKPSIKDVAAQIGREIRRELVQQIPYEILKALTMSPMDEEVCSLKGKASNLDRGISKNLSDNCVCSSNRKVPFNFPHGVNVKIEKKAPSSKLAQKIKLEKAHTQSSKKKPAQVITTSINRINNVSAPNLSGEAAALYKASLSKSSLKMKFTKKRIKK